MNPEKILNRQDQPFVVRVLSYTTNHGILVFPEIEGNKAELDFNHMYFEQAQNNVFRQNIEIDFSKLQSIKELRS